MRSERGHVARRGLALGECRARDVEAVVLDRVEHAQPGVGGIARQQDHLDVLLVRPIEPQQLLHQHECRSHGEDLVLVLDLVAVIGPDPVLGVDPVAFGEVEQRARADRDDELGGEARGHAASIGEAAMHGSRRGPGLPILASRGAPQSVALGVRQRRADLPDGPHERLARHVERRRDAHDGAVRVLRQDAAREQAIDDVARGDPLADRPRCR